MSRNPKLSEALGMRGTVPKLNARPIQLTPEIIRECRRRGATEIEGLEALAQEVRAAERRVRRRRESAKTLAVQIAATVIAIGLAILILWGGAQLTPTGTDPYSSGTEAGAQDVQP